MDMKTRHKGWETPDHELYRDTVRRFLEAEAVPRREAWIEQGYCDKAFWRRAGEVGLLCPDIPTEYGGGGCDFGFDTIVYEELMRAGISSFGSGIQSIVAHYLLVYGTPAQRERYLPAMARGELVTSIAMTEPGTGSDLQAVKTRAIRDGDHYVVNGSKTFITNGHNADLIVLVCKTDPKERARGISLLLVETAELAGFKRGKPLKKIGQKGQDTCELFFTDCRIPAANVLGGQEGQGFYQLMNQLGRERLIIAISAVASMEACVEKTTEYIKQREAFGRKLIDFQTAKFTVVECKTETRIARVYVDHCIEALIAGELSNEDASMAKYWCTEKAFDIAHRCLQLHGGYGYIMDYPIANYFADARVGMIYGGSNEIMKELISRAL